MSHYGGKFDPQSLIYEEEIEKLKVPKPDPLLILDLYQRLTGRFVRFERIHGNCEYGSVKIKLEVPTIDNFAPVDQWRNEE